jgi:hypothetical protein
MTTMAAMLGAAPLAIGFGEGSELRRPLGITIVGGLIVSQLATLYTTPVIYLYLDRFRLWAHRPREARDSRLTLGRGYSTCCRSGVRQEEVLALDAPGRAPPPFPLRPAGEG